MVVIIGDSSTENEDSSTENEDSSTENEDSSHAVQGVVGPRSPLAEDSSQELHEAIDAGRVD